MVKISVISGAESLSSVSMFIGLRLRLPWLYLRHAVGIQ